jgi:cardiolipin synthase
MLEDIASATDHIHLLIYGYKPGEIGETFLTALAEKAAAGVEVRLAVDAIGSEVDFKSKDLFRRLREAGIEIVAHDGIVVLRSGDLGARTFQRHGEDLLHFDHRKMVVIDGRVGYVGGADRGPLQRRAVLRRDVPGRGSIVAQLSRSSC